MCKGATGTKLQRWPLIERSLGLLRTNLQSMSDQHNEKITQIYKYVQRGDWHLFINYDDQK